MRRRHHAVSAVGNRQEGMECAAYITNGCRLSISSVLVPSADNSVVILLVIAFVGDSRGLAFKSEMATFGTLAGMLIQTVGLATSTTCRDLLDVP